MSASSRVLKSSTFLLAIEKVQRSPGIVRILILARLLTPEHFGVVALVTITQQFFELLVENGNHQYMVQKDNIEGADLNTAYRMYIVIKTGMAIIVIAKTYLKEAYYETPELNAARSLPDLPPQFGPWKISRNGRANTKPLSIRIIFL